MLLYLIDILYCFFFNDTATTEIYTLSLHDALPIFTRVVPDAELGAAVHALARELAQGRSEEHTSELQSPMYLVCRLLLEKKKDGLHNEGDRRTDQVCR